MAAGFDLLGHALVALGDRVTVRATDEPVVTIRALQDLDLPLEPERNTAGAGLLRLIRDLELPFGFEVVLDKQIPTGSGMGGSAASAAAAIVAANALLPEPLTQTQLLTYGMEGERVASGSFQADNLAPCILGGLVLARPTDPPDVVRLPVPGRLRCVLVHPRLRLDTRAARAVLPAHVPMRDHVAQSANLAGLVAGCFADDLELIGRSLADLVVEPHRAPLVPGFAAVQRAAMTAGALGCSLSGSGPSVFAWCDGEEAGLEIRVRMVAAFAAAGVEARGWVSPVDAPGAALVP